MKLFRHFLSRQRSNKKNASSPPSNITSNGNLHLLNPSSGGDDQTRSLIDKQNKCTCRYFATRVPRPPVNTSRPQKTSTAVQTSSNDNQRRHAKIQTNTMTLCPIRKSTISSTRLL